MEEDGAGRQVGAPAVEVELVGIAAQQLGGLAHPVDIAERDLQPAGLADDVAVDLRQLVGIGLAPHLQHLLGGDVHHGQASR